MTVVLSSLVIKDIVYEAKDQGQDFFLKAKVKAKTFMRSPRGSPRPRQASRRGQQDYR